MTNPITQRDVAQACGLHPSTVCLALKNSPSIPEATRRMIQATAEELGYQPNVGARNLALLRTERKGGGSLPIAWINQEARRDHWRADPEARVLLEAAQKRAAEAGYHLEEIWTREPGMTAARVVQILRARGVEGVLFPAHRSFDFSLLNQGWSEFAMVGLNDHRLGEWIDVVCSDHHRNLGQALRRLRHLGFERIGLVLTAQVDAASGGLAHGAFLRHQAESIPDDRVPVFLTRECGECTDRAFTEWLEEHRPDAVICQDAGLATVVQGAGCGAIVVRLNGTGESFDAGTDPCTTEIAAAAVGCVVDKMRRFEKGLRDSTRLHLVKGAWQECGLQRRERDVQSVVA